VVQGEVPAEARTPRGSSLHRRFDSPIHAWLDFVFGVIMIGVALRMLDKV
jgi:threonine/homoserine/homoserine lactone efflux protein